VSLKTLCDKKTQISLQKQFLTHQETKLSLKTLSEKPRDRTVSKDIQDKPRDKTVSKDTLRQKKIKLSPKTISDTPRDKTVSKDTF